LDLGKATRTHVNSIYIRGTLSFKGYKRFNVDCYVDTGASMCLANKHVIPPEFWQKTREPIYAKLADDTIHELDIVATKIEILIEDKIFIIPTLYQTESRYDILLGNNFYRLYEPFAQWGYMFTRLCRETNIADMTSPQEEENPEEFQQEFFEDDGIFAQDILINQSLLDQVSKTSLTLSPDDASFWWKGHAD